MTWPWNRPTAALPTAQANGPDLALEARLRALEDRLAHIVADAGLLRIEWSEVLDKISHWASRQSGREGKVAKQRLDALASQDAPGDPNGAPPVSQPYPTDKAALRALLRSRQGQRTGA